MNQREKRGRRLIDRWWVQLSIGLWLLAIVTIYFRLRISELLEVAGRGP